MIVGLLNQPKKQWRTVNTTPNHELYALRPWLKLTEAERKLTSSSGFVNTDMAILKLSIMYRLKATSTLLVKYVLSKTCVRVLGVKNVF